MRIIVSLMFALGVAPAAFAGSSFTADTARVATAKNCCPKGCCCGCKSGEPCKCALRKKALLNFYIGTCRPRNPPQAPAGPTTDPAVIALLQQLVNAQTQPRTDPNTALLQQIVAMLAARNIAQPTAPPAASLIILQPNAPGISLPIGGAPGIALPIAGSPGISLPIGGSPGIALPVPGTPGVTLPPSGAPKIALPIAPLAAPVAPPAPTGFLRLSRVRADMKGSVSR